MNYIELMHYIEFMNYVEYNMNYVEFRDTDQELFDDAK